MNVTAHVNNVFQDISSTVGRQKNLHVTENNKYSWVFSPD